MQVNTPFHFVAYGDSRFHDPKDTEGANPPVRQAGLGLAIAKWITDSHHARLSVTSKENAGAVFELVLPVCIVDSSLPKAASIAASVANLG